MPGYIFFSFVQKYSSSWQKTKKGRKLRMLFCFCSFIHLSTWTLWHCFPNGGLLMPETWYLDWNYQCLASFSLREDNNTGKFHFLNIPQTKIFSNLLCINILAFESIFYCASYKYRHSLFFFLQEAVHSNIPSITEATI